MVKIAIVNDNFQQLRLYEQGLRHFGFDIIDTALDGKEAIENNRRNPAQIILMNYCMPNMRGTEATQRILAEFPKTKIIIESVWGDIEDHAIDAGAIRFLRGPSIKELIKTIKEVTLEFD